MNNDLVEKVMDEVLRRVEEKGININPHESNVATLNNLSNFGLTEFVGTARGHTIGLVIANVEPQLHEMMKIDKKYRSIGIIGARTGAGPQIFAADEAVKATNCEAVCIELPRDTEGGAGHGCLIILGSEDVSDAKRAVEVTLKEIERTMGDVYSSPAGHLEFEYTARASGVINMAFGAPLGQAFGMVIGAPAAIGVVLADVAAKAATVKAVSYASPSSGTSFSNEVIFSFTGDSGAVRQAVIAAREVGKKLLATLDPTPIVSTTVPYI